MKTHRKLSANAGLGLVLAWVASVPVLTAEPPVAGGEAAGQAQSVTSAAPAPSILADPPVAAAGAVGQAQSVNLPPEGSPPLLRNVELLFPTQGNVASVEPLSYLYYMEVGDLVSAPSQQKWVPLHGSHRTGGHRRCPEAVGHRLSGRYLARGRRRTVGQRCCREASHLQPRRAAARQDGDI